MRLYKSFPFHELKHKYMFCFSLSIVTSIKNLCYWILVLQLRSEQVDNSNLDSDTRVCRVFRVKRQQSCKKTESPLVNWILKLLLHHVSMCSEKWNYWKMVPVSSSTKPPVKAKTFNSYMSKYVEYIDWCKDTMSN